MALREIETLPNGLIEAIVFYRGYRYLKDELAAAEKRNDTDMTGDPKFRIVYETEAVLLQRRHRGP